MSDITLRLSRTRLAKMRADLEIWQAPDVLSLMVDSMMDEIGSEALFNQAGLAFLRDAWVAAKFAKAPGGDQVRLSSGEWPDFEVRTASQVALFESTEADDPQRRRGEEYREDIGARDDPFEAWIDRVNKTPEWIRRVTLKKATKGYSGKANLVVYLNMTEYGARQRQVEQCFKDATSSAAAKFASVWVLWKEKAYKVWPTE